MVGPLSPNSLRNTLFAANMDYQVLLAVLLVVFILAAAFLTSCYTPLPLKTSQTNWPVQVAKWLRVAGMVHPSEWKIQISLLTGPGL
jgi:hypothetical protein